MNVDRMMSIVLTAAAVAMAIVVVRREITTPRTVTAAHAPPKFERGWRELEYRGAASGSLNAPIQIIEFSDLECPFCRRLHVDIQRAEQTFPGMVRVVFIHDPLLMHAHAKPAALGAVCALRQDRFRPYIDAVFGEQDSLETKSVLRYALAAGVADSLAFKHCLSDKESLAAVDQGIALADSMSVTGTPVVLINGWRFNGVPDDSTFDDAVRRLAGGKKLSY